MSQEDIEKKEHKNKVIMSVVLGVIMLLSTAGYFVMDFSSSQTNSIKYNDFLFKQNEYGLWDFSLNNQAYQTFFNPKQTENISVIITRTLSSYTNLPLYFSAEPIQDLSGNGAQEIIKNIPQIPSRVNYACLNENCSADYVLKDCQKDNIIIFEKNQNNQTRVFEKDKCIVVSYSLDEEQRAVDALIFKLLGISN